MQARFLRRTAFTLIELLVVLAILSLLAAILFPIFARVRAEARRAACIAQLRQIGLALAMYREDYEDLPPRLSLVTEGYVSAPALLVCPNDPRRGQFAGNVRLEGNTYLHSGVSYCYVPQWAVAQELGWWQPPPAFGPGKWGDLTPVVECPWHWAKTFKPDQDHNDPGSKGWQLELMMSGSVRKIRVEDPVELFTPDKYR
jgi:prepilin-type N-terminal cleavage/methylation domain-containing protein